MNRLLTRFLCLVLAWSLALPLQANSARSGLEEAADYNLVVFGNFSSPYYSSATGRIAVQGNITLNNYGLVTDLPDEEAGISVVAGGDMHFGNGQIYAGHSLIGGSADQVSSAVRNSLNPEQQLLDQVDVPLDFASLRTRMIEHSESLGQLPANGTVQFQYGGLRFVGDCESDLQVFHLEGDQLLEAHSLDMECVPEQAHVIINVSGAIAGLRQLSLETLRPYRKRVLFNFYQATQLELTHVGVQGSVLAPRADIDNPTGDLNGTVVANSWSGPMHLNYVRYQGYREDVSVCEGPLNEQ